MKNRRRSTAHLLAFAIALITLPSSGQDNAPLADAGTDAPPFRDVERHSTAPITDDGREADELQPASQLLISFEQEVRGSVSIDILDEQGRCVHHQAFASEPGANMLPIDVSGLEQGRYAVRVQSGATAHISRFRRDR